MSLKDPFEDKEWKILEDDWEDELIIRPIREERSKWEEIDDDDDDDNDNEDWLDDDSDDDEDWSDLKDDDEDWEDVDEDDDFDE